MIFFKHVMFVIHSQGQKRLHGPYNIMAVKNYLTIFSGGIIALGVFGGFVFLAAIITTIVILIRR